MPSYDGDVRLSVGLDADDAVMTARKLRGEIADIFDAASDKDLGTKFKSLQASMSAAVTQSEKLESKMQDLAYKKIPTDEYKKLQKEISDTEKKLIALDDRKGKFLKTGGKTSSRTFLGIQFDIKQLTEQLGLAKEELNDLVNSGKAFNEGWQTPQFDALAQQLDGVNNRMIVLRTRAQDAMTAFENNPETKIAEIEAQIESLQNRLAELDEEILERQELGEPFKDLEEQAIACEDEIQALDAQLTELSDDEEDVEPTESAFHRLRGAVGDAAKRVIHLSIQIAKFGAQTIRKGIDKLAQSFRNLGRKSNDVTRGFQRGFKNLLRYGIGVRSMFALINKLRRAFMEGMNNLAESYAPFGETLQNFKTALAGLKNNFAAAFEPVLSTVLPILTTLINALNEVVSKIGQFFAALKGQTTYLKGAAKAQNKYGSAMGGSAKKADELQRQLAGFDDVQILKAPNDSSGGGGGGSTGDGFENVFETAAVDSDIINFVNRLKTLFQQQDWAGLGTLIADGVNTAFQKAKDLITSDELREKIRTIVTGITETANSIVDGIDWELIGSTLGEGFNLIIDTLDSLITGFDWISIGASLASGLNSLITTIDWSALGKFFADKLNILVDTLHGFLFGDGESEGFDWVGAAQKFSESLMSFIENIHWAEAGQDISQALVGALQFINVAIQEFNWQELGNDIFELIANIDWAELFTQACELIGSIIGGLAGLVWGVLEPIGKSIGDWFEGRIEYWKEQGVDIIGGILFGILEAVGNIFIWIYDNIFKPIYDGICKAFGISSPAEEMKEPGKMIIEGLKEGFLNGVKKIGSWIDEHIFGPIQEAFDSAVVLVKVGLEKAQQWAADAWTALQKGGQTVISTVKAAVQRAQTWVADAWTAATMKVQTVVRTVQSAVEKAKTWVADAWTAATMKIQSVVRTVQAAVKKAATWVADAWSAVKMAANTVTRTLQAAVKKAATWIADAWKAATAVASTVTKTVQAAVKKSATWVADAWTAAKTVAGMVTKTVISAVKKSSTWVADAWAAAKTTSGTIYKTLQIGVSWIGNKLSEAWKVISGRASGGIYKVGMGWKNLPQFARGGFIANGIMSAWNRIPKYAGGTSNAHGTLFAAGENGPEIIGNINGRTEILNKSQIASAIYSAVLSAMGNAVNALGRYLNASISQCLRMFSVNTLAVQTALQSIKPELITRLNEVNNTLMRLSDITAQIAVPAVATGAVIPYTTNYPAIDQNALDTHAILEYLQQMPTFTTDELSSIIDDVLRRRLNIDFYIGDEQLAKHVNSGNLKLDRRYNR